LAAITPARQNCAMPWSKTDLINELGAIHGYRSYLEIATATTGHLFGQVDRKRYSSSVRLLYRCDPQYDDGMPIDYRIQGLEIWPALLKLHARLVKFDAILVDPFHEYRQSARDLRAALSLLKPNGTIVVHDCRPNNESMAHPTYRPGPWCGVTYKAFVDLTLRALGPAHCTVDTDMGCGVLRRRPLAAGLKNAMRRALGAVPDGPQADIVRQWRRAGDDYSAAYRLMMAHPKALSNLVSVDAFLAGERNGAPALR
jgi:hypothetical protein